MKFIMENFMSAALKLAHHKKLWLGLLQLLVIASLLP